MRNSTLFIFLFFNIFYATAAVYTYTGPAMGNWNTASNWSAGVIPTAADTALLNGSSVILNATTTVKSLVLAQNCTINGTGQLTISGNLDLTAGGNHNFEVRLISNGDVQGNQVTMNMNVSSFVVNGTGYFYKSAFWMISTGLFEINAGAVVTFNERNNFYGFLPNASFIVRGKIIKTGPNAMDFEAIYLFKKAEVEIQAGFIVNFLQSGPDCTIDSSTVTIALNASLDIARVIHIKQSTITGAGSLRLFGGITYVESPNNIQVDILHNSGNLSAINAPTTLAGNYTLKGGIMSAYSGADSLVIGGNLDFTKGQTTKMNVLGFTTISDTTAATTGQKTLAGHLTVAGGGLYTGNDFMPGTLKIPAGATFTFNAQTANVGTSVQNFGVLRKENNDSTTLDFVTNKGRIEAIGSLKMGHAAEGTITPGFGTGVGTLTVSGTSFYWLPTSNIEISIQETGGVVAHDVLRFINKTSIKGKLTVLESGNIPEGDYTVITGTDTLKNTFTTLQLPPNWTVLYNPFSIVLRKSIAPPQAGFTVSASEGCAPLAVQFQNTSTGSNLSYSWTFPGGVPATSTAANPTVTFSTPGQVTAILTTSNSSGSSTTSVEIVVYAPVTVTTSAILCAGETFSFGGQQLTATGAYTAVFQNWQGCDSTVNLVLNGAPSYNTAIQATICEGESYPLGSELLTMSNIYGYNGQSVFGCDSFITLTLTVVPNPATALNVAICAGSEYVYNGQTYTNSGAYTHVFTSVNGCDSTVTLHLSVLPSINQVISATICQGSTYQFGTQSLTATGVYTEVFTAAAGCDSVVTLNLEVNPTLFTQIYATVCNGDTLVFGGQNLTLTGNYTHVFTSSSGCDSTVKLQLVVLAPIYVFLSTAFCYGDTFPFGGQLITQSGSYMHVFQSIHGCDSTVQLLLSVIPQKTRMYMDTLCAGETYSFYGQTLTEPGVYVGLTPNPNGCDSLITLTLSVHTVDASVSVDPSVPSLTANAPNATYQWIDCVDSSFILGATDAVFQPTVSGSYAVLVTENGCSTMSDCYNVTTIGTEGPSDDSLVFISPNPAADQVFLQINAPVGTVSSLDIVDMHGRSVYVQHEFPNSAIPIELAGWALGVYVVRVVISGKINQFRLVHI